jgi:hypothetical protein
VTKRLRFLLVGVAFMTMLSMLGTQVAAAQVKHLVFDLTDGKFYCLGSPINCEFDQ